MRFDIITIGSGTVDVFVHPATPEIEKHAGHLDVCYHIGEKILVDKLTVDTGGGGTNTAVAFARLGLRTGWLGVLGTDMNAQIVRDALQQEGVQLLGPTVEGMTGYSVIMVGLRKDRAILAYKGVNDRLRTSPHLSAPWLYCSSMMGDSFHTLVRIVKQAKAKGVKYAFNPSMYIARLGAAKLRPLIDDCDLLVCNREEAAAILGKGASDVRALLRGLQEHAKLVVVTDGAKGAWATNGIDMFTIKPRPIKVVETTGAGDSFAAGVVAGLVLRNDLVFGLQCGMAEAESVIQHIGAKNILLRRTQLLRESQRYKVARSVL